MVGRAISGRVRALGPPALRCGLRGMIGFECHILGGQVHWDQVDQGCQ